MAKRSASPTAAASASSPPAKKRARTASSPAASTSSEETDDGVPVLGKGKWKDWPAPTDAMEHAREFFRECATGQHLTIIVPDKDADGLSSCMVAHRTLTALGLSKDLIKVHLLQKATSLFKPIEQERLEGIINESLSGLSGDNATESPAREARVIVLDQGSRPGPALVRSSHTTASAVRTLIVDHHMSDAFPEGAEVLSACYSPPISTTSLLMYLTCSPLHPSLPAQTAWYGLLGIFGDLGQSEINWTAKEDKTEWPVAASQMTFLGEEAKRVGKSALAKAVSALNAPRRTSDYDVPGAWKVLFEAEKPEDISSSSFLNDARDRVAKEVERCTHTAPKFSKDGRCALLRINSGFQVHPVIATRWAGTLKGAKKLQMIMVENEGHNPDPEYTSFSCRIPNTLRKLPESERPNLIALLKEYGEITGDGFLERVGEDFARGHKEATGGIIRKSDFELFASVGMEIGVKDPNAPLTKKEKAEKEAKSNGNLKSFFSITPTKKVKEKKEEEEEGQSKGVDKTPASSPSRPVQPSSSAKGKGKLEKHDIEALSV